MTEATTQETTEPVKYGKDVSAALQAYEDIRRAAIKDRDDAHEQIAKPITDIDAALRDLFGHYSDTPYHVLGLVKELSRESRTRKQKTASEACQARIDAAEKNRDAALGQDPFVNYLVNTVAPNGYESHVNAMLRILPATVDEMKTLADEHDWCTDFERLCHEAAKAEAVDFDTVECVRRVHWDYVPPKYESKEGEKWEIVLQLPAYIRPHKYDLYELIDYAVSVEYRKVTETEDDTAAE